MKVKNIEKNLSKTNEIIIGYENFFELAFDKFFVNPEKNLLKENNLLIEYKFKFDVFLEYMRGVNRLIRIKHLELSEICCYVKELFQSNLNI